MALTPEQIDEEEASGLLRLTVGGSERRVPELKRVENRLWQRRIRDTFAALVQTGAEPDSPEGLEAMADAERELVLAYDATRVLGDLSDATEREIAAIYNRLVEVSYPLATSPMAAMTAVLRAVLRASLEAAASPPGSSTSSRSPRGTSAPTRSTRRSPSASSSASTARRRRGSSATGASA